MWKMCQPNGTDEKATMKQLKLKVQGKTSKIMELGYEIDIWITRYTFSMSK